MLVLQWRSFQLQISETTFEDEVFKTSRRLSCTVLVVQGPLSLAHLHLDQRISLVVPGIGIDCATLVYILGRSNKSFVAIIAVVNRHNPHSSVSPTIESIYQGGLIVKASSKKDLALALELRYLVNSLYHTRGWSREV